jgi:hypothetical protein
MSLLKMQSYFRFLFAYCQPKKRLFHIQRGVFNQAYNLLIVLRILLGADHAAVNVADFLLHFPQPLSQGQA